MEEKKEYRNFLVTVGGNATYMRLLSFIIIIVRKKARRDAGVSEESPVTMTTAPAPTQEYSLLPFVFCFCFLCIKLLVYTLCFTTDEIF